MARAKKKKLFLVFANNRCFMDSLTLISKYIFQPVNAEFITRENLTITYDSDIRIEGPDGFHVR